MQNLFNPVSIAGGYWTGSSAIVDLLSEHTQCTIVPDEFSLFSYGQFFEEVHHPLHGGVIERDLFDQNLIRFEEFNKLEIPLLRSVARYIFALLNMYPSRIFSHRVGMNKKLGGSYANACHRLLHFVRKRAGEPEDRNVEQLNELIFDVLHEAAKAAINKSGGHGRCDGRIAIFDQLVAPPYADYALLALPSLKIISVDRDFRDQYIEVRNRLKRMVSVNSKLRVRPWGEPPDIDPSDSMDFFVKLRKRIEDVKSFQTVNMTQNVLWLNFEDIVLQTEQVAEQVFRFLGLNPSCWHPNSNFNPTVSLKNIGKWKASPYVSEIDCIAMQLGI